MNIYKLPFLPILPYELWIIIFKYRRLNFKKRIFKTHLAFLITEHAMDVKMEMNNEGFLDEVIDELPEPEGVWRSYIFGPQDCVREGVQCLYNHCSAETCLESYGNDRYGETFIYVPTNPLLCFYPMDQEKYLALEDHNDENSSWIKTSINNCNRFNIIDWNSTL